MEVAQRQRSKNKFGQYFTPEDVARFMVDLADINPCSRILEPACGEGVFLRIIQEKVHGALTGYEVDPDLGCEFEDVRRESFVTAAIQDRFDLIIGNPPYIKWANLEEALKAELRSHVLWNTYFNRLCDYSGIFILKAIELLEENGQLIFICPEYWLTTTHALPLRNYMVENGFFEELYHFNETPIFENASVSLVIFKYIKSKAKANKPIRIAKYTSGKRPTAEVLEKLKRREQVKGAEYLSIRAFRPNERWLLVDDATRRQLENLEAACRAQSATGVELDNRTYATVGDVCDIGNGLVSGLDKAFQIDSRHLNALEKQAILKVVKAKNLQPYYATGHRDYVYLPNGLTEENLAQGYPHFFQHFQQYRSELEKRYQYKREIHYWEWVFLRNLQLFSRNESRILVPCKERISNKNHFRFALAEPALFPTQDVTALLRKAHTRESTEYILAYLNNPRVFNWLKINGIVKGNIVEFSERPIASIPFRKIDWANPVEVQCHDTITACVQELIAGHDLLQRIRIEELFDQLLEDKVVADEGVVAA